MSSRTLVLGANGQVGFHLRQTLSEAFFWGRAELDLADAARVEAAVLDFAPDCIVNAAAYTAVDRAESDAALAWRVNAEAPAALARAAHILNAALVHISTDYVFDGTLQRPYRATDPVSPINVYGQTKLAGELAVRSLCERYWILRTSWVFSEHGANFLKTMLRLAGERDVLRIVDDQHGCPTYAGDLAALIAGLLQTGSPAINHGVYHVAGGSPTTWRRFAEAIFTGATTRGLVAKPPVVEPITTRDYPTPAARPPNSVLAADPVLFARTGVHPNWRDGLATALDRLAAGGDS